MPARSARPCTVFLCCAALMLAGCGGGSGSGGQADSVSAPQIISGTLTGLTGSGLVLQNNAGDDLAVAADGVFSFGTPLAAGASYAVTVKTQPKVPAQNCALSNSMGTVGSGPVTDVAIHCAPVAPRLLFVSDGWTYTVKSWSVDAASGTLTAASSFNNGATSFSAVLSPDNHFLYVVNGATDSISAYGVDATAGALSALAGSPFAVTGDDPSAAAVSPDGQFLYAVSQMSNTVDAFRRHGDGSLSPLGSSPPIGNGLTHLAITPNGKHLYVASYYDRAVYGYSIDPLNGTLTQVTSFVFSSANSRSLAMDPSGRFLYVANHSTSVNALAINGATGALSQVPGSPFATGGDRSSAAAVDGSGRYLYVTNTNSRNLSAFAIEQTTGALSALPGSPVALGYMPHVVKADPGGRFLFVAAQGSEHLDVHTIDSATGLLTRVAGAPFMSGLSNPGGIAILAD